MSELHLIRDAREVLRRRTLLPPGTFVEVWPDLELEDHVWVGQDAKTLLDGAGPVLAPVLSVDGNQVAIYYGPWLTDTEGLPTEQSLRTRIVSAHGIAAAWVTRDRFGQRTEVRPTSPLDATFALRRPRTGVAHLWRLFRTDDEARAYLREFYGDDPEALAWADRIAVRSYAELLERHARGGEPGAR
ncbi:MAG: hypothetical protein HYU51_14555 [Candidatus Rokubacteria bacterium]|nr:hypothetical protein [Candidatus Rokubacteria bacterium]